VFSSCGVLLASILAILSTFVWPYFTGGLPPVSCEIVRRWTINEAGEFTYWEDYMNAIVDKDNLPGTIGIYNMDDNETPDWVLNKQIPASQFEHPCRKE
jgi:hypothetical protein